ncbi:helix-turn-helix domain-containing protein, partial [Streptomyces sp. SS]|uniref:helix-turn-helix domain-containing protein n=1 Tax=Streptomyces sp. SS TaxID=260742 RepID=UPI00307AD841
MELRLLATFEKVADVLSFTRAAAELGYAQSSVTGQIRSLESSLGVERQPHPPHRGRRAAPPVRPPHGGPRGGGQGRRRGHRGALRPDRRRHDGVPHLVPAA